MIFNGLHSHSGGTIGGIRDRASARGERVGRMRQLDYGRGLRRPRGRRSNRDARGELVSVRRRSAPAFAIWTSPMATRAANANAPSCSGGCAIPTCRYSSPIRWRRWSASSPSSGRPRSEKPWPMATVFFVRGKGRRNFGVLQKCRSRFRIPNSPPSWKPPVRSRRVIATPSCAMSPPSWRSIPSLVPVSSVASAPDSSAST